MSWPSLKDLALRAVWRLMAEAGANNQRRIEEGKRAQVRSGARCRIEYDRIVLKPRARVTMGDDSMLCGTCILEREDAVIEIGSRTYFAGLVSCAARVRIGDDVLVSSGGYIADHASHALEFAGRRDDVVGWIGDAKDWSNVDIAPVTIGDKAWIGFNVIILKGVSIGEGAVVGAGTVVTKDVAPYTVVAGNPAQIIRRLDGPHEPRIGAGNGQFPA